MASMSAATNIKAFSKLFLSTHGYASSGARVWLAGTAEAESGEGAGAKGL
jgi:hypothetical protein